MSIPVCKRGEIWLVNFNPGRGSEQQGVRPSLVIQNNIGNKHGSTTIIAAITTTLKKYPITVLLSPQEGGLKEPSMANLAQILTIDKNRLIKKLGALDTAKLQEIDAAVMISLGIGL